MANKTTKQSVPRLNPAFDPKWQYSGKFHTPLKKGYIRSDPSATFGKTGAQAGWIQFLFNPAQVGISHTMNANVATGQAAIPDQVAAMGTIIGQYGDTSVSLQFDRTYEVWHGTSKQGVFDDVNAFYRLVGITNTKTGAPVEPMGNVGVWLYFGDVINMFGYINTLNITYTAWSEELIPIRAQIDISLTLMTPTNGSTASLGGITTTTTYPTGLKYSVQQGTVVQNR